MPATIGSQGAAEDRAPQHHQAEGAHPSHQRRVLGVRVHREGSAEADQRAQGKREVPGGARDQVRHQADRGGAVLHPQAGLLPSRSEARKHPHFRELGREDHRLRHRQGNPQSASLHRVRLHQVVSGAIASVPVSHLLGASGHFRLGLLGGGNVPQEAAFPGQQRDGPDQQDLLSDRIAHDAELARGVQARRQEGNQFPGVLRNLLGECLARLSQGRPQLHCRVSEVGTVEAHDGCPTAVASFHRKRRIEAHRTEAERQLPHCHQNRIAAQADEVQQNSDGFRKGPLIRGTAQQLRHEDQIRQEHRQRRG